MTSSTRPTWDEYFIGLVDSVAARSTCDRGRSGCVIVVHNQLITTGYVGSPPGFEHCDDVGHLWSEDGKHCVRTLHAEQNAILQAARLGVSLAGATVYCTMEPCITCAMMLISLQIDAVFAKNAYHASSRSLEMFDRAGVDVFTASQEPLYES